METFPTFKKCRAFNKAVGPGKKYKINKRRPTFIPDYRVLRRDSKNGKKCCFYIWLKVPI